MKNKEKEIIRAKFKVKNRILLETDISEDFNSCYIIIKAESNMVVQKSQAKKLVLIDIKENVKKQQ